MNRINNSPKIDWKIEFMVKELEKADAIIAKVGSKFLNYIYPVDENTAAAEMQTFADLSAGIDKAVEQIKTYGTEKSANNSPKVSGNTETSLRKDSNSRECETGEGYGKGYRIGVHPEEKFH